MLRIDEAGERIPLTMNEADAQAGTVTIVFQAVGATTMRLARMKAGEALLLTSSARSATPPSSKERAVRASSAAAWAAPSPIPRRSGFTIMVAKSMSSPVSARLTWLYSKTSSLLARIARSS